MKTQGFNATDCNGYYNRSHVINTAVPAGSLLKCIDSRAPESSEVARLSHGYNRIFYGIDYYYLPVLPDIELLLHAHGESIDNPATPDPNIVGVKVICSADRINFAVSLGTFAAETERNITDDSIPNNGAWLKLAWYNISVQGQQFSSMFWVNNTPFPFSAHFAEVDTSTRHYPANYYFAPGTPDGIKIGMSWVGFEQDMTLPKFEKIVARHSGNIPFFLGRQGDYPTSRPATAYINCSAATLYDKAFDGYYSDLNPGAPVDIAHINDLCIMDNILPLP